MPLLLAIWLLALLALLGIVFSARNRQGASQDAVGNLGDFFVDELKRMGADLLKAFAHVRPHGERVVMQSAALVKRGHTALVEKAIGRIAVEKGKASSFFLKRIAEHKESLNAKDREK